MQRLIHLMPTLAMAMLISGCGGVEPLQEERRAPASISNDTDEPSQEQSNNVDVTPDYRDDNSSTKSSTYSAPVDPSPSDIVQGYTLKKVYYGTNRIPLENLSERWAAYRSSRRWWVVFVVIGLLCGAMSWLGSKWRKTKALLAVLCVAIGIWFVRSASLERQQTKLDDKNQNRRYGHEINDADGKYTMERGFCWVSVPEVHKQGSGELELPEFYEFKVDPNKHFQLQRVRHADSDAFLADFKQSVTESDSRHAFVFIHGFNVTFQEAALRTAQLKHDLGFDGPAAFFSWPSNGEILSYASDAETVNLTVESGVLRDFLVDLIDKSGAKSIHLIAHSMGSRALTRVFKQLPDKKNSNGEKLINQLVMAAPDVNADEFKILADTIRQLTRGRTIYASEKDIALIGSEILRLSDYKRLGQGGEHRTVVDGVRTIDASDLDIEMFDLGHSYYVHPKVLQDLKHLLLSSDANEERPWLRQIKNYWIFRGSQSY